MQVRVKNWTIDDDNDNDDDSDDDDGNNNDDEGCKDSVRNRSGEKR